MKGKILDFNFQNKLGVILAEDGNRYSMNSIEWKSNNSPDINQIVDFVIDGDNAVSIYMDKIESLPETKSKVLTVLLALFFGGLGLHKFYLGCNTAGFIMLVLFLGGFVIFGISTFIVGIIAFIEFIKYIFTAKEDFQRIYFENKKCWF